MLLSTVQIDMIPARYRTLQPLCLAPVAVSYFLLPFFFFCSSSLLVLLNYHYLFIYPPRDLSSRTFFYLANKRRTYFRRVYKVRLSENLEREVGRGFTENYGARDCSLAVKVALCMMFP